MKRWIVVVLSLLLLAGAGAGIWWRVTNTRKQERDYPRPSDEERIRQEHYFGFLMTTGSGHHGEMDNGKWKGSIPFYRDGPLMVYAPQAGWHGEARRPVFVVMMR